MLNLWLTPMIVRYAMGRALLAFFFVPIVSYFVIAPESLFSWVFLVVIWWVISRSVAHGPLCKIAPTRLLKDKTILVTGGNCGIGFEICRKLCELEAHVYMACRNMTRAEVALDMLKREYPSARVTLLTLDLGDRKSISNCVRKFHTLSRTLDCLINNAGVFTLDKQEQTKDGFDLQYGTNYLGPYLLTRMLYRALVRSKGRVINVSSVASFLITPSSPIFSDYISSSTTSPYARYGISKLANALDARALHLKLSSQGLVAVAVHPGAIMSQLYRRILPGKVYRLMTKTILPMVFQTCHEGAKTVLFCVLSDQIKGGEFYADCNLISRKWQHPLLANDEASLILARNTRQLWKATIKKPLPLVSMQLVKRSRFCW